jgi:hypothetical protein
MFHRLAYLPPILANFFLVAISSVSSLSAAERVVYVASFRPPNGSSTFLDVDAHEGELWKHTNIERVGTPTGKASPPLTAVSNAHFLEKIKGEIQNGLLLVVHGYNTPKADALSMTLDASKHAGKHGVVVLFHWQSRGKWYRYSEDNAVAHESGIGLGILIKKIKHQTSSPIDMFAFSLGSVVAFGSATFNSLRYVVLMAPAASQWMPDQLKRFTTRKENLRWAERITVYESTRDWALKAAALLGYDPMGRKLIELGEWNIIDVSDTCEPKRWQYPLQTKISDSHYYLRCPAVGVDMALVFSGLSAEQRKLKKDASIWRIKSQSP